MTQSLVLQEAEHSRYSSQKDLSGKQSCLAAVSEAGLTLVVKNTLTSSAETEPKAASALRDSVSVLWLDLSAS